MLHVRSTARLGCDVAESAQRCEPVPRVAVPNLSNLSGCPMGECSVGASAPAEHTRCNVVGSAQQEEGLRRSTFIGRPWSSRFGIPAAALVLMVIPSCGSPSRTRVDRAVGALVEAIVADARIHGVGSEPVGDEVLFDIQSSFISSHGRMSCRGVRVRIRRCSCRRPSAPCVTKMRFVWRLSAPMSSVERPCIRTARLPGRADGRRRGSHRHVLAHGSASDGTLTHWMDTNAARARAKRRSMGNQEAQRDHEYLNVQAITPSKSSLEDDIMRGAAPPQGGRLPAAYGSCAAVRVGRTSHEDRARVPALRAAAPDWPGFVIPMVDLMRRAILGGAAFA